MSSYRYMRITSSGQPKIAKGVWYQSEIPPPRVGRLLFLIKRIPKLAYSLYEVGILRLFPDNSIEEAIMKLPSEVIFFSGRLLSK